MRLLGLLHVIDLIADSLEAEKKGDPVYVWHRGQHSFWP